jgi:Mce-associated membrane protein
LVEPKSGPEEERLGDPPLGPGPGEPALGGERWPGDQRSGSAPRHLARRRDAETPRVEPQEASFPDEQGEYDGSSGQERASPERRSDEQTPIEEQQPGEELESNEDTALAVHSTNTAPAVDAASAPGWYGEKSPSRLQRVRRALGGNRVAAILGVVTIGLAVSLALVLMQLGNKSAVETARASAVSAAKTYSVELAAYNYRHLDKDFGIVLAHSTPSFRKSFTESSDALKSTLTKYHATSKATVVAAGLISASTTRAVALVFLDQTVTNSTQKRATTDRSQVEITLVRVGGKWMIDQVTLL